MTLPATALRRARRTALLMALTGLGGPAWGITTCTASANTLSFGDVVMNGQKDTTATITVHCTTTLSLGLSGRVYVLMCLRIGDGSGGVSGSNRLMKNSFSDPLTFQIYRDPAHSHTWGDATEYVDLSLTYNAALLVGGSGETSATMYGRIPAQTGLAEGTHSSSFAGTDAQIDYRFRDPLLIGPDPTSCTSGGNGGGSIHFPFTATANVPAACTITSVGTLDFGSVAGLIQADVDQSTTLNFICTGRTPWQVSLDNGQHASGSTRRMRMGTLHVSYELYRDAARTLRWGSTLNADTATGTGTGSAQSLTVYGRVPQPQSVTPGTYTDTVIVTIHY